MNEDQTPVAVVVSTYNGEAFIEEQIESVFAQVGVNAVLFVRDDGSSDGTCEILSRYEARGRLHLIRGCNRGVVASFLEGLAAVPREYAYVALCDQDDVWLPDHLLRAINVIKAHDNSIPQLYCSEYWFCDAQARLRAPSHLNRIGVGFPQMLYENVTSGNTMLLNRVLVDEVCAAGIDGVYCHDWWIALVASALGELHYDEARALRYRRAEGNASVTGTGALQILRHRVRSFLKGGQLACVTAQLSRLNDLYGQALDAEKRALLDKALFGGRIAKAFTPVRLRQKVSEELALRLLFLMGKL